MVERLGAVRRGHSGDLDRLWIVEAELMAQPGPRRWQWGGCSGPPRYNHPGKDDGDVGMSAAGGRATAVSVAQHHAGAAGGAQAGAEGLGVCAGLAADLGHVQPARHPGSARVAVGDLLAAQDPGVAVAQP